MTKKVLFGMAAFSMLFATSCQNEIDSVNAGKTSTVSFKVETPEIKSRAYSDGTTATHLQYAVYDAAGNELTDLTVTDGVIHGSTKVDLTLTTGNTYSVIFWAAAPGAPYTVDFAAKTMTVNYEGAVSNAENRDAFYKYYEFTVKGTQTETIELKRPFAQLNIGTADYEASKSAGYVPTHSSVKVSNVYNKLNLKDGRVTNKAEFTVNGGTSSSGNGITINGGTANGNDSSSEEPNLVSFASNSIPVEYNVEDNKFTYSEEFPVAGYEYLAMNYLLVDAEKEIVDVEFTYTDGNIAHTRKVGSVPVQRNYRTNIYGNLLTSEVDINVTINPVYNEPSNDVEVPAIVVAYSADDVKEVFVNGGTVVLGDDITFERITSIEPGAEVFLNLNGKTITVEDNTTSNTLLYVKEGAKLTIDGNGIIDLGAVSTMAMFAPYGELVIENGTFIRSEVTTVTDKTTGLFMGAKTTASNVTINGGYFDSGYYNSDAADIEEILAGTKNLEETADDIAKRGNSNDANKVRVALKDNVSALLNHSGYGVFKIYGGTFVGANPAWGDEGCMLPTTPNYLRPWSYYQGALLDGQEFNENGIVLPEGYSIAKGTHEDGRPTYTVTYNK